MACQPKDTKRRECASMQERERDTPSHLAPLFTQLEETPETAPYSRAEGLLFLHGLESNPGSSLQTEEESGQLRPLRGLQETDLQCSSHFLNLYS